MSFLNKKLIKKLDYKVELINKATTVNFKYIIKIDIFRQKSENSRSRNQITYWNISRSTIMIHQHEDVKAKATGKNLKILKQKGIK